MGQASIDRRERQRETTRAEIRATARELLVESGLEAVSVSAIARRMGMSGPAIYRYYASHDDLVGAVVAELFAELADALDGARGAGVPGDRLLAMARALRSWATGHRVQFRLLFAAPVPESSRRPDSERQRAGEQFDRVFLTEVEAIWAERPFPTVDLDGLDPDLRRQVTAYAERKGTMLPPAAVQVFLACWVRLYGLLVMEALDQLAFAYTDPEPVFEACLEDLSAALGIDYRR